MTEEPGQIVGNYIDVGDVVRIIGNSHKLGSDDLKAHQGQRGVVTFNDGWGLCTVALDEGAVVKAWNGVDLERA